MSDPWSILYDATKYIAKSVSSANDQIAANPGLQVAQAQNTATQQQADQQAQQQAQQAQQKAIADNTKITVLGAQDKDLIKQAGAASSGFTSTVLTGSRGVDRDKEKTSAVVLGGSNSGGAGRLGQSDSVGSAALGMSNARGAMTAGGGMGAKAGKPKMMLGRAANG